VSAAPARAGDSTTPPTPAPAQVTLDRGVTQAQIKIGNPLFDIGSFSKLGYSVPGADPNEQRSFWDTYLNGINKAGGVLSRQVVPAYYVYDLLSDSSMRAACLYFTQDQKVFAVLEAGIFNGPAVLCVTEENATPLLSWGGAAFAQSWFGRSKGMLFSVLLSGARSMRTMARDADREGLLANKKVGILVDGAFGQDETLAALVAELRQMGRDVSHISNLSSDRGTASSQIPVEVQQMRSSGAQVIFVLTNSITSTQFVREADSGAYTPRYLTSDWQVGTSDDADANMPDSFDGSVGFSPVRWNDGKVGIPEPAFDTACREEYEHATGTTLPRDSDGYSVALNTCTVFKLFVRAVQGLTTAITRPALSQSLQGLGPIQSARLGGGSFGNGKFDAADLIRTTRWSKGCKCWLAIDDFRATSG
jgi:hypothetical protein